MGESPDRSSVTYPLSFTSFSIDGSYPNMSVTCTEGGGEEGEEDGEGREGREEGEEVKEEPESGSNGRLITRSMIDLDGDSCSDGDSGRLIAHSSLDIDSDSCCVLMTDTSVSMGGSGETETGGEEGAGGQLVDSD